MTLQSDRPVTFSQGQHGEVYVTQGYGYQPQVLRPSSDVPEDVGIAGPTVAPTITQGQDKTYYVARLDIKDRGSEYTSPPLISIAGSTPDQDTDESEEVDSTLPPRRTPIPGSTEEASAICRISQDYVSETEMLDPGRGYASPPVATLSGGGGSGAKLTSIVRATFRGDYYCYYRYLDDSVLPEEGGPLYSNLSPVTKLKSGDGMDKITWDLTSIKDNVPDGMKLELWRTTGGQQIVVYRLGVWEKDADGNLLQVVPDFDGEYTPTPNEFLDDLHDSELQDPLREGFQAMPITLPNGTINANRFTPPPDMYAVGVFFQDRWWMGVHAPATATEKPQPNTLRYSEQGEPSAMPEVNELIIQQNLRSADYITALVPYAGSMIVMQSRHCHRLTYVVQPIIDAGISLFAYRGCLNQRCWDIFEGRLFSMDSAGVYSITPQGEMDDLSVGIDDIFSDKIDWSKSKWFLVRAERSLNVLRISVAYVGDPGVYPTRQLVYALDYKAWWEERYSNLLPAGCDVKKPSGQNALYYGSASGGVYELGSGSTDDGSEWISGCNIDEPGRGYRKSPDIQINSDTGSGAELSASIDSNGSLTGVIVKHCGTGYKSADKVVVADAPTGGKTAELSLSITESGDAPVHYSVKTGNMEFVNDTMNKGDGSAMNRQVSVVYKPTDGTSVLNLETYYNGAEVPRSNVVRRDRGVGFVNADDVPAATLNMKATNEELAESTGVARALFSGRTLDDIQGNDRHIAVGLSGKQNNSRIVLHSVDVHGVMGGE